MPVPPGGLAPATARHEERLVEEMLDHDRRVAEGVVRQAIAHGVSIELLVVDLPLEEEVDQVEPSLLRRYVEVQPAVEATGPQERRVEVVRPGRRGYQQEV